MTIINIGIDRNGIAWGSSDHQRFQRGDTMENLENLEKPIDETVKVEMTSDGMLGVVSFSEPQNGGSLLTQVEILQAIVKSGIVAGVKKDVIDEIVISKYYQHKYIIAQGERAVDGENAKVEFTFDVEKLGKLAPRENGDGTVDFKDLDCVRNVKKGEVLAIKTPATEGVNGRNIFGRELRARKGRDVRMPMGKNTVLSEDGLKLLAAEDGKLEYDGYNISVSTVCFIPGDVDNSTGNIDFVGSVIIGGSVHDGFVVKAKGSIEVRGAVEGATLIAGGDIILSYGIQGNDTSKLEAGGNIVAKFIQNANVDADGDIIAEGIWNSTVNAGGVVKVDVGKGSIMGGNIMATNVVMARNVGSSMGVITGIQTGIKPEVVSLQKELEADILHEEGELNDVEKEILYMKTHYIGEKLDHVKKVRLQRLMYSRQTLVDQLEADRKRYESIKKRVESATDGMVKVSGTIYPGTKMTFGNLYKEITYPKKSCTYRKIGHEIYVGAYEDDFVSAHQAVEDKSYEVTEAGVFVKEFGQRHLRNTK